MARLFLIVACIFGLSECATVGTILQGAGQGLQRGAREPSSSQSLNCIGHVMGDIVTTNCN